MKWRAMLYQRRLEACDFGKDCRKLLGHFSKQGIQREKHSGPAANWSETGHHHVQGCRIVDQLLMTQVHKEVIGVDINQVTE